MLRMNIEEDGFEEFQKELLALDIDGAIDRAQRRFLRDLRDQIIQNLKDDPDLNPGFQTNDNRGGGHSIFTESAWLIEPVGGGYRLRLSDTSTGEHKSTPAERAFYLEFGTDGPITPKNSETLHFENQAGEEIFPTAVEGVDPHNFWRRAIVQTVSSGDYPDEIEQAINEEFEAKIQ